MRVMLASEAAPPGDRNLDWAAATGSGIAVVLDGLTESGESGCVHGTPWYVNQLGTRLIALAGGSGLTLADALAEAIEQVGGSHGDGCDLSHPGAPGATAAAVRLRDTALDYLVLSDTVIVLDTGAEPVVVTDVAAGDHLPELTAAAATGTPDALIALIEAQQRIRNQPGGYWVAQHDPEAARHAITGTVEQPRGAVLLSDGAALLATEFGALSWSELLDVAYASGPADLIAATRELELRDLDRAIWPRYKVHDDATAVVCQI